MKNLFYILFAISANLSAQNNIIWGEAQIVTMGDNDNLHPRIALDRNENPMVIWGNSSMQTVHFSKWNGFEFNADIALNDMSMDIFTASWAGPDLASFGDTIYVVFKENPEDVARIHMVHSYDGGINFSAPVEVDAMLGDNVSRFPSVTTNDDGQPIVEFMKLDSDFSNARYVVVSSGDFGNSFSMDVIASEYSSGDVCDCCPASVVAENNYVATLYRDNLDNLRNSWAGISVDGGMSFNDGIQLDQTDWIINACPASGPDGIIIGDSLYSVFMSAGEGDERVYFSASSLNTLADQPDLRLTGEVFGLSQQNYPRIANYGNAVAVVWKQTVGISSAVPILFSPNIQDRFQNEYDTIALLETYGIENADVAVSSNAIHVVWQDNISGDVMYRKGIYAEEVSILSPSTIHSELNVFPNPAKDKAFINVGNINMKSLCVINMHGEIINVEFIMEDNLVSVKIDQLPTGIFAILLKDDSGNQFISRLIVE